MRRLTLAFLSFAIPATIALAADAPAARLAETLQRAWPAPRDPDTLMEKVRRATERFKNINVALSEGWKPATPCVSGPNSGAMGVHLVNGGLVGDGVLDADYPEALIYEPMAGGAMRLVGVEFIEIADVWNTKHHDDQGNPLQPVLEGHLLNLVAGPNRYTLPAFYELHVWAWEHNPNGTFADWNTLVSCDRQPGTD
jgi:hypothetical protein